MSHTPCDRSDFLVPMRWLHAGGDLSRPNHIHKGAIRPFTRTEGVSKSPGRSPDLPFMQTCKCYRARIPPAADLDADINSP
jgi:hypothetical protein